MYFEVDKALDTSILQKSIDLLVDRHPLLNCSLSRSFWGYLWKSEDRLKKVELKYQECNIVDRTKIAELLKQNAWQEKFKIFGERHLKAYYLQTSSSCYVQLVPNHILADARSSDLLMSDLANIYNCLSQGKPVVFDRSDTFQSYSSNALALFAGDLSFVKKLQFFFLALTNIVSDIFKSENGIAIASPKHKGGKRGETRVVCNEIDTGIVEKMKPRLKHRGFTIHPILVLSVLRTVKDYNERRGKKTDLIRVSDMFSLLPFVKKDLTNVYDCFVVPFTSYYKISDDDMEMMASIREGIELYKEGDILQELFRQGIYTFTGIFSPKKMATKLVTRFVVKNNIVISNPGKVKFYIPDFGESIIRSYTSFSQLFPPARIFFLFRTFRKKLHLNILYDGNAFSDEEVEKEIFPGFLENIQRISDKLGDFIELKVDKPQTCEKTLLRGALK